jgi:hypothetical protein
VQSIPAALPVQQITWQDPTSTIFTRPLVVRAQSSNTTQPSNKLTIPPGRCSNQLHRLRSFGADRIASTRATATLNQAFVTIPEPAFTAMPSHYHHKVYATSLAPLLYQTNAHPDPEQYSFGTRELAGLACADKSRVTLRRPCSSAHPTETETLRYFSQALQVVMAMFQRCGSLNVTNTV